MKITKEDFSAWKDNPITQSVLQYARNVSDSVRETWLEVSWDNENPDREKLAYLKGQAETAEDIADIELKDIQEDEQGKES